MWRGDESPYHGKHYSLERPLNSPQSLTRPHPPIMIGGGGEKKTLRFVARYADACNLFVGPDLALITREEAKADGLSDADLRTDEQFVSFIGNLRVHADRWLA